MGLRGPAPKPSAIEAAEGFPGHRAPNLGEPQFDRIIPDCPAHLSEKAREKWNELAPILHRAQLMTEGDQIMLGNLCQAFATMAQAQEMLSKTSLVIKTSTGALQKSPLLAIIRDSMDMVNRMCREFGLSPSSRSRISVGNTQQETDLLDDALFGRGSKLLVLRKPD